MTGVQTCALPISETAPNSPAWLGSETTANRALNLINQGVLQDSSVGQLAERLGISERYLRKLCADFLGASPGQLENARRLLLAKSLLSDSNLAISDIAFASGFGSLRRFNEVWKETYGKKPSEMRSKLNVSSGDIIQVKINKPEEHDLRPLLNFFSARAIPGIEVVDKTSYRRNILLGDQQVSYCLSDDGNKGQYELTVNLPEPTKLPHLLRLVRKQFDLESDSRTILRLLSKQSALQPSLTKTQDIRLPGSVYPFEVGIRAIIGQQISVKAAKTLLKRLVAKVYNVEPEQLQEHRVTFPTPHDILETDLSGLGITKTRVEYIRHLALAAVEDRSLFDAVAIVADRREKLLAIRGVGPWTADYILMRAFAEPDAIPMADLGIKQALAKNLQRDELPSEKEIALMSEEWRPYRAYAAIALWNSLAEDGAHD